MAKYINDYSFLENPKNYKIERIDGGFEKFYRGLAAGRNILEGKEREEAVARRNKATKLFLELNDYININKNKGKGFRLARTIRPMIGMDVTAEEIKNDLSAHKISDENDFNCAASRKLWRRRLKEAVEEYKKPGHGLFDMNQTDEELVNNFNVILPMIAAFAQNAGDLVTLKNASKAAGEISEEEKTLDEAIALHNILADYYSYFINRFDMILSPSYELFGNTQTTILDEYNSYNLSENEQDGNKALTQAVTDMSNLSFTSAYALYASISEFIAAHKADKDELLDCVAYDDFGNEEKLKNILPSSEKISFDVAPNHIFFTNKDGKLAELKKNPAGRYEYITELPAKDKEKAENVKKVIEDYKTVSEGILKPVSVFSKNGLPVKIGENFKQGMLKAALKYGEVYYRTEDNKLHSLTCADGKIEDKPVANEDEVFENISAYYRKGITEGLKPENVDEEFIELYTAVKAEPFTGGERFYNKYYSKLFAERADNLAGKTTLGYSSDLYENIVSSLRDLSVVFPKLSITEKEEMLGVVNSMASEYLAGKNEADIQNSYTAGRITVVMNLQEDLKKFSKYNGTLKNDFQRTVFGKGKTLDRADVKLIDRVYKRLFASTKFKNDNYSRYKSFVKNAGKAPDERNKAFFELNKKQSFKLMQAGVRNEKLDQKTLDIIYSFSEEIISFLALDKDTALYAMRMYFNPANAYSKEIPTNVLKKLRKASEKLFIKEIDKEAFYGIFNIGDYEEKLDRTFKNLTFDKLIENAGNNYEKAYNNLLTIVGYKGNKLFDYDTLQGKIGGLIDKEIKKEKIEFDVLFNNIKKTYLDDRIKRFRIQEKSRIECSKCMDYGVNGILRSMYGESGIAARLLKIMDSGDKTFRHSSSLYKEIQADLKKLANHKSVNNGFDLRYGRTYLAAIAEKAERYLESHKERELTYTLNSYEGKRIDCVRKVYAQISEYNRKLLKSKAYLNEGCPSKEELFDYRDKLLTRFENSTFNWSFLREIVAIETNKKNKDNDNSAMENSLVNLDDYNKEADSTYSIIRKIMQEGLKNKKIDFNQASVIFNTLSSAIGKLKENHTADVNEICKDITMPEAVMNELKKFAEENKIPKNGQHVIMDDDNIIRT